LDGPFEGEGGVCNSKARMSNSDPLKEKGEYSDPLKEKGELFCNSKMPRPIFLRTDDFDNEAKNCF